MEKVQCIRAIGAGLQLFLESPKPLYASGRFGYLSKTYRGRLLKEKIGENEVVILGAGKRGKYCHMLLTAQEIRAEVLFISGGDAACEVLYEALKDSGNGIKVFTKSELEKILKDAGFSNYRFYSVLPDLTRPQLILSENYLPNEPIEVRVFPQYNNPETVFLEEERLYQSLMDNRMFHQMANAFLIECPLGGEISKVDQVTVQGDRSPKEAMATIICYKEFVAKRALYPEGCGKVNVLAENERYLKQHGVPVVAARLEKNAYVMPYIEAVIATDYFRGLLQRDFKVFIRELEKFRQMIVNSSEHMKSFFIT